MKKTLSWLCLASLTIVALPAEAGEATEEAADEAPRVAIVTSMGEIVVELFPAEAPKSVENFLAYVQRGFYEGTVFHRVKPGFMIQGGGFDENLRRRPPAGMLMNEADNGLSNQRGTISMARQNEPHTATCQFFINHVDNPGLDHRGKENGAAWGYTVFGKVVEGMEVVDAIAAVETGRRPNGMSDVPREAIVIEKATRLNEPEAPESQGP